MRIFVIKLIPFKYFFKKLHTELFMKLISVILQIINNRSMILFKIAIIFINILTINNSISCQDQHCVSCSSYAQNNVTYRECGICQYLWHMGNTSCIRTPSCNTAFCEQCDEIGKYCIRCNKYYTLGIYKCQLKPYMVGIISTACSVLVIVVSIILIHHYCKRISFGGNDQSNEQGNQRNINVFDTNTSFRIHDAQNIIHNGNNQNQKIKVRRKELLTFVYKLQRTQLFCSSNTCAICLSDHCNTITPCNHYFHFLCLVFWVQKQNTCPLCKIQLKEDVKLITCNNCRDQYELHNLNKAREEDLQIYKSQNRKLLCPECKDNKKLKEIVPICQSQPNDEHQGIR